MNPKFSVIRVCSGKGFGEGEAPAERVCLVGAARQERRPPTSGDELVGMAQRPGGSTQ
jgi:hypothetical protein